ncbi:MAG TPA: HAD-IIIC family phosphatase [bacterium]|nr:HAD-IIIC family phosphatase [bacterium]HPN44930.1 HAD-IIIC family phosphatase [bacterium]
MSPDKIRGVLLADFNIQNLAGYLNNNADLPETQVKSAPFGQVVPALMNAGDALWRENPDFAVIWARPESIFPAFQQALNYMPPQVEKILAEVDEFSVLLLNLRGRVKTVFIMQWVYPTWHRGLGVMDLKTGVGISNLLMQMNLRLADNLQDRAEFIVLPVQKWLEMTGPSAFNSKLDYMGKIAFANPVFALAARDIKAGLRAVSGQARKLILLDLDDTLWGGIVGDLGWEKIRLGGHDPVGEAYVDFQKTLQALSRRGIVLGLVSKNEESIALEAIEKHPEMVLKTDNFAGWRINWQDKAQNIVDLVRDLNLGLQSVVFIDDNPVERARVREALPEALVPEWPADPMLYKSALLSLNCFDTLATSSEDLGRTEMYVSERKRKTLLEKMESLDDWLHTLEMQVTIQPLTEVDLARTAQLLNKTNQMNLSTRRLTEPELAAWVAQPGNRLWTCRVSDKFGDSGLTGIVSMTVTANQGQIVDFILSCRVMGRKVEETMIYTAIDYARSLGLQQVCARYLPTAKNKPCLSFLQNSGMTYREDNVYCWDTGMGYPVPAHINLKLLPGDAHD